MEATLIRASERPMVAWKNRGGQTRELMCWPPGASMASFRWRLSVAKIASDGPFSSFPGYDRSLVLLSGAGMDLAFAERTQRVDPEHSRVDFAGEADLHCRLLAGPTSDFNLMVARGEVASLSDYAVSGDCTLAAAAGEWIALYLCSGEVQTEQGPMRAGDLLYGSALTLRGAGKALRLSLPL